MDIFDFVELEHWNCGSIITVEKIDCGYNNQRMVKFGAATKTKCIC